MDNDDTNKTPKPDKKKSEHPILDLIISILIFLRVIYSKIVRLVLSIVTKRIYSCPELPKSEETLLTEPAYSLVKSIKEGKVLSATVVTAFINRAKQVQPINAVVEDRFNEALEKSRKIDKRINELMNMKDIDGEDEQDLFLPKTLKELKEQFPFLGLPFSTKENVKAKGFKNTGGLYCRKDYVSEIDSEVVLLFKKSGAILVCTTNVPELGMWYETSNVVYGTTKNPYDLTRTPGGSTGGEGALMTAGGIPLSIGTDIGGSLGCPAYCCGIFSHKPSVDWVSLKGAGIFDSKLTKATALVAGPLARYTEDLIAMMEVMAPTKAKDLRHNIDRVIVEDVTVWWAKDLGRSPLFSPVDKQLVDLLDNVKEFLKSKGCTIKELDLEKYTKDVVKYWNNKLNDDYAAEPPMQYDMTNRKYSSNLIIEFLKWATFMGKHTFPVLGFATNQALSKPVTFDASESKFYWKKLQDVFMEKFQFGNNIILMPTLPIIAPYHNEPIFNTYDFGFGCLFNAIEFPVTQVPLGLDKHKLPMGLQIATTPDNDHVSLAVSRVLEKQYGGWSPNTLVKKTPSS